MKCKFCQREKKLIQAHIIPEGFFRRLKDGQDPPRIVNPNAFPKRAPIGVYDTTILCEDCEKMFGDWDCHAQQVLCADPIGEPIKLEGRTVAYKIRDFKYDHLKLFFISLAWRASVSSEAFYSRIDLGPYEDIAKAMISTSDPGTDNDFATTIAKFDEHPLSTAILDPHPERWQGITYCRFYLSSYVVYIKIDKRSAPQPHSDFKIKCGEPLYVVCRDLSRSKELPLIYKMTQSVSKKVRGKKTGP
jgi:hypothetical protein